MPYMKRLLGNVTYSSGSTTTLNLPREHFYNRLLLHVILNDTGGTGSTYQVNAQLNAVTRIDIIANGQLVIKSFSWVQKMLNNVLLYGQPAYEVGRGLAASRDYRASAIVIEFGINTSDITALLPSHLLSSLDLKATWLATGSASLFATGGAAASMGGIDVYSLELINQGQDARAAILNKETVLELTPSATGFAEFLAPLGNVYRSFNLQTQGGGTAGFQNNTVTDIEVVQDGVVYHRKTFFKEFLFENILETSYWDSQNNAGGTAASESAALNLGFATGSVSAWATSTSVANIPAGNILINFDYQNYNQGGSSNPVALVRALPHLPDSSRMATWKVRCNVANGSTSVILDLLMNELIIPKVRRR